MLAVTALRAFADNYIWLIRGAQQRAAVVDPGDAAPVIAALEAENLTLSAVLTTHHHNDHVGGAAELSDRYSLPERPIPIFGPSRENIAAVTHSIDGGKRIALDDMGLEFQVFDIPGHTRGHIAYYGHEAVFCGDTLFSAGCGRLFEGTPEQMSRSLALLKALPSGTRVFCGHEYTVANLRFAQAVEPENEDIRAYLATAHGLRSRGEPTLPSTMQLEIAVNPFLRCEEPTVRAAAESHAGRPLESAVEVFAVIRQWKDGFRAT